MRPGIEQGRRPGMGMGPGMGMRPGMGQRMGKPGMSQRSGMTGLGAANRRPGHSPTQSTSVPRQGNVGSYFDGPPHLSAAYAPQNNDQVRI
jgi:hypothetical protein